MKAGHPQVDSGGQIGAPHLAKPKAANSPPIERTPLSRGGGDLLGGEEEVAHHQGNGEGAGVVWRRRGGDEEVEQKAERDASSPQPAGRGEEHWDGALDDDGYGGGDVCHTSWKPRWREAVRQARIEELQEEDGGARASRVEEGRVQLPQRRAKVEDKVLGTHDGSSHTYRHLPYDRRRLVTIAMLLVPMGARVARRSAARVARREIDARDGSGDGGVGKEVPDEKIPDKRQLRRAPSEDASMGDEE